MKTMTIELMTYQKTIKKESAIKDKYIVERRTISCTDDELQNFLNDLFQNKVMLQRHHVPKTLFSDNIKLKTDLFGADSQTW